MIKTIPYPISPLPTYKLPNFLTYQLNSRPLLEHLGHRNRPLFGLEILKNGYEGPLRKSGAIQHMHHRGLGIRFLFGEDALDQHFELVEGDEHLGMKLEICSCFCLGSSAAW